MHRPVDARTPAVSGKQRGLSVNRGLGWVESLSQAVDLPFDSSSVASPTPPTPHYSFWGERNYAYIWRMMVLISSLPFHAIPQKMVKIADED
ncbi:hypothetical protein chiPu_0007841 [Chiloscyllium punctatum]|uniref:Uncharacterized protein n=1 Tax=Chiloscyllium punctatum TaxID=137246 RepID=A0A401SG60_CHIPU|nr:hypothetical protein [Chiloscyllium punctatum]